MKRIKYTAAIPRHLLTAFQNGIWQWYHGHGRDLPWRRSRDPYAVIVSEIMLHQTTVATVIPVFEEFMRTFPDVEALHAAPLGAIKAITDPLGYKVRGSWLKAIADHVVDDLAGEWPDTVEGWMAMPGVGRYTAGAVLSLAFGQDAPILDTNVKRVLGRFFGIEWKDSKAETLHRLWALAEGVLPPGEAMHFNQALMDFGAMVCTARKPGCTICPALDDCITVGGEFPSAAAEEAASYTVALREGAGA
jgi:A/G-specific adenine glycosylase